MRGCGHKVWRDASIQSKLSWVSGGTENAGADKLFKAGSSGNVIFMDGTGELGPEVVDGALQTPFLAEQGEHFVPLTGGDGADEAELLRLWNIGPGVFHTVVKRGAPTPELSCRVAGSSAAKGEWRIMVWGKMGMVNSLCS